MKHSVVESPAWRDGPNPDWIGLIQGSALLAVLATIHWVSGYSDPLKLLYVLPVWYTIRRGGNILGMFVVVMASLVLAGGDSIRNGQFQYALFSRETCLYLIALSAVGWVVGQVERSLATSNHLAKQDPLTGLMNRRALYQRVQQNRQSPTAQLPEIAVMVDCDCFKHLNDSHGHVVGDSILQILANVLITETRGSDMAARVGGDEFFLLLRDISEQEASLVVTRIERAFEQRVQDAGYQCTLSSGFVVIEDSQLPIEEVINAADQAMYRQKEHKKASVFLN